jgi:putative membrane protein
MWGYGMGAFWMVLIWASLAFAIVWVVKATSQAAPRRSRALEILEERYARGEIDHQEFTRRRSELVP